MKRNLILSTLTIATVGLMLFGCGSTETEPQKVGEVQTEEVATTESTEEVIKEFVPGDILETETLRISFVSAEEYVSDNKYNQPAEGNVYYKVEFEFENIGTNDEFVSSWDFEAYADDYSIDQAYVGNDDTLSATISSGRKTKGAIYYEISASTESFILEYTPNIFLNEKIYFVVK